MGGAWKVYLFFRGLPQRSVQGFLNTPAALHVGCLALSMGACAPSTQNICAGGNVGIHKFHLVSLCSF